MQRDGDAIRRARLQAQFDATLEEYRAEMADFRALDDTNFVSLLQSAWWGTSAIDRETNTATNTVEECQQLCAATTACSGATFDPSSTTCWLRQGNGTVQPSTSKQAVVRPAALALGNLQAKNSELLALASQLTEQVPTTTGDGSNMAQIYDALLRERANFQAMSNDAGNIRRDEADSATYATQQFSRYNVWWALLLLLVVMLNARLGGPRAVKSAAVVLAVLLALSTVNLSNASTWTVVVLGLGALVGLRA
jgi:hypothetical protein